MKLPAPSWLTPKEARAFLVEQGVSDKESMAALQRAFLNGEIRTRGRSKAYHEHNTLVELDATAWDQATVNWFIPALENSFFIPGHYGKTIRISNVGVFRHDLERWLAVDAPGADSPSKTIEVLPICWTGLAAI